MSGPQAIRERVRKRLREQRALIHALLGLREQLQGSLFVRYGVCGKPSCACRRGARHGPYYVLSRRQAGSGGFAYLDPPRAAQARELVARYREFQRGLRRLRKVNLALVGLLQRYQRAMAQRGGRRIGLGAQP